MIKKYTLLVLVLAALALLSGCDKKVSAVQEKTEEKTEENVEQNVEQNVDSNLYAAYQIIDDEKLYGYIDTTGAYVVEPSYAYASDYSEGYAITYDGVMYRMIDKNGKIIFENAGVIESVENGAAIFTDSNTYKKGLVGTNGTIIAEPIYQIIENFNSDGTALVSSTMGIFERLDKTGKILQTYALDSKFTSIYETLDGYAAYTHADTFKMGIVSIVDARIVLEPDFNEIINLGDGYFAAKDPTNESFDTMMTPSAIYNSLGKQLSDYQYYDVSPFHEGLASATDDRYTFFIGTDGQKVNTLPSVEGRGSLIKIGTLIKADIDGDLSYLNAEGKTIWKADTTVTLSDHVKVFENRYKPLRLVNIKYPSVTGLKDKAIEATINEKLKVDFTKIRSEEDLLNLSVEDNFSASLIKNLLIIEKNGYDYYSGAAHGMPIRDYYYININTGVSYAFKDLFKQDSDYLNTLSDMIRQQMQKITDGGESMFFPDSFTGLTEFSYFMLNKDSITLYFYPYDIAPYAAGFPEFNIPFADITEFIDKNGDFFKSFNP